MNFNIHVHHHFNPSKIEESLMAISAEVQALLDQARQNTSLVASVDLGLKAQAAQIADLQNQIAALPGLSDEDRAAIVEATADLAAANATLQADIPANTTPEPEPEPVADPAPATPTE
jgi:hypothetical protein